MDISLAPRLSQNQKLTLTPRLAEYLKILQLTSIELAELIKEELRCNPVLEVSGSTAKEHFNFNLNHSSIPADGIHKNMDINNKTARNSTLREYLREQLIDLKTEPDKTGIITYMIECIDENGYFNESLKNISLLFNISITDARKYLKLIQEMDPPGVGARNLKECILIQLHRKKKLNEEIKNIVINHLDLLGKHKLDELSKKTGISVIQLRNLLETIKAINPRPGAFFSIKDPDQYVIPELTLVQTGDMYEVNYSSDLLPSLCISSYYRSIIKDPGCERETKQYLRQMLSKASIVVQAIEQRKRTLLKIASFIVHYQKDFLQYGPQHMKPLTMKFLADLLEISESTVSRAIKGKYIQLPGGVYELRYFFSNYVGKNQDNMVSAFCAKEILKQIVAGENRSKPLSDEQIRIKMVEKGIPIARRTIAKYREQLSILPASLRKK